MRTKLVCLGMVLSIGLMAAGCGSGDAAASGDAKNQIDAKAKPTLPAPSAAIGGAPAGGAAKAEPN